MQICMYFKNIRFSEKVTCCLGIFLDQVKVQMVKIAFCQVWMQEIWIQFRILFLIQIGMSTDNNAEMTMVGLINSF